MAIHLFFGADLESLAAQLASGLVGERGPSALSVSRVVVPNGSVKQWLQMQLALRNGVAANIVFPFLEEGLWEALAMLRGGGGGDVRADGVRFLDRQLLQLMVLQWVRAAAAAELDDAAPFRRYLGSSAAPAFSRKLWQLSARLTGLLAEYEYNRPDWVAAWLAGRTLMDSGDPQLASLERSLQALLVGIRGANGIRDRLDAAGGSRTVTLSEFAAATLGTRAARPGASSAAPLHVFAMSQLSRFHCELLFRLGEHIDVRLYQFAVCCEFWEDMETGSERAWRLRREQFDRIRAIPLVAGESPGPPGLLPTEPPEALSEAGLDNPLLQAWGKCGRETVRLLSDCEERFPAAACRGHWCHPESRSPRSVLHRLQQSIAARLPPPLDLADDGSLRLVACPSLHREVETVYHSIIAYTRADPTLKLTDIAVLVPDMARYKPAFGFVFDGNGQVPYNLIDSTAAEDSIFGRALIALLALADSSFTRRDVFALIFNPCFLQRTAISRDEARQWLAWADALGIFRDTAAAPSDSLDPFGWKQGLFRLRLGRIMDADGCPGDGFFAGAIPYADQETGDAAAIGRLSVSIEALHRQIAPLATLRAPLDVWRERIEAIAERFLDIPDDRPSEGLVRARLFEGLLDAVRLDPALAESDGLALPLVRELVGSLLADIPSRRGTYLSRGVCIASLRPMRPIPFRIVYVLGLTEGDFPGQEPESPLDLRAVKRRIGDLSKPDCNRFLFLETLMATRERLILSYVDRDLQKDEAKYPCAVIRRLQEAAPWLQPLSVPLTGSSQEHLEADQPLLTNWSPVHRVEGLMRAAQRGARLVGPAVGDAPDATQALTETFAACRPRVRVRFVPPAPATDDHAETPLFRVTLRRLADFLDDPIAAALKHHLHLFEEQEDTRALAEDEPFASESQIAYQLEREALTEFVRSGDEAATMTWLRHHHQAAARACRAPQGAFGAVDRHRLERTVACRIHGTGGKRGLAALLEAQRHRQQRVRVVIGEVETDEPCDLRLPPLTLSVRPGDRPVTVELSGSLPFVWEDDGVIGAALDLTNTEELSTKKPHRAWLRCFLFGALAAAHSDLALASPCELLVAYRKTILTLPGFAATPEQARAWLTELMHDFLGPSRFDRLPLAALDKLPPGLRPWARRFDDTDPGSETAAQDAAEFRHAFEDAVAAVDESRFGPGTPDLVRLSEATVPDDALPKLRRRLLPALSGAFAASPPGTAHA